MSTIRGRSPLGLLITGAFLIGSFLLFVTLPASTASFAAAPESRLTALSWRVQTPAYTFTADGVVVAGYESNDRPGAPALPVVHKLMELPQTGDWALAYEGEARAVTTPPSFRIATVPVPAKGPEEYVDWMSSEAELSVPVEDRPDPAIYERNAFYPDEPVVTGREVWQRGQRLLQVSVYPFQINPVSGELRYHPDVDVTVTVTGIDGREGT